MTKEQLEKMPAWKPWLSWGRGDCFEGWVEWMSSANSLQSFIWKLSTYDAMQLYSVMNQMTWDCHNKHTAFKETE